MNPQCMVLMSSTSLCFIWFTSKKWHILIDLSGSFDFNRRFLAEHQSFYHANWNNRITCIITLEASAAKHGKFLSLWHIYCLTAEGKILSCDSTNKPHAWGLFESHGAICAYCICLWLYTLPPDVNSVRPGDEYMRRWIAMNVDSVDGLTSNKRYVIIWSDSILGSSFDNIWRPWHHATKAFKGLIFYFDYPISPKSHYLACII